MPEDGAEEAAPAKDLAKEQEKIAEAASAVSQRLQDMARSLRQNKLLEPAEDRRFRDEVAKPLDEVAEERLPESAAEIGSLPESEKPSEQAAQAQRKAEKISDELKKVAGKLAGTGDFREILSRLELIIDLQKKAIGETERRIPQVEPQEKAHETPAEPNATKEKRL